MDFAVPKYIRQIIDESGITSEDGVHIKCYKITPDLSDDDVLDDQAKHIRRHYRTDEDLKDAVTTLAISESEYLKSLVIPQKSQAWGSQAIAAELGEIMLYYLFEHILNYIALRGRHWDKPHRHRLFKGLM